MDVIFILFGISLILLFGFLAEFIFKKTYVPDVLFLIILGVAIGPYFLNYVPLSQIKDIAPIFTTFTLLFLLFDGAFSIDLSSFAKGLANSIFLTMFNFVVSVTVIFMIMLFFGFSALTALLTGFILGGVSSAFVIPLLNQLNITGESYTMLTLESALTDVLCIVSSLTVMQIMVLNTFDLHTTLVRITSLFAIAGTVGIVAGIFWIIIVTKIFKEHKSYMITLAYLILVYVVAEYLNGNGAIASLFFGIVLRNSKQLIGIFHGIVRRRKDVSENTGLSVTTPSERMFYDQISFFLKTFFFVYIGALIDFSQIKIIVIGVLISSVLLLSRNASALITKKFHKFDRLLIRSIFARGLAAAAIAEMAVQINIANADMISKITSIVILGTLVFSSLRIFMLRKRMPAIETN